MKMVEMACGSRAAGCRNSALSSHRRGNMASRGPPCLCFVLVESVASGTRAVCLHHRCDHEPHAPSTRKHGRSGRKKKRVGRTSLIDPAKGERWTHPCNLMRVSTPLADAVPSSSTAGDLGAIGGVWLELKKAARRKGDRHFLHNQKATLETGLLAWCLSVSTTRHSIRGS